MNTNTDQREHHKQYIQELTDRYLDLVRQARSINSPRLETLRQLVSPHIPYENICSLTPRQKAWQAYIRFTNYLVSPLHIHRSRSPVLNIAITGYLFQLEVVFLLISLLELLVMSGVKLPFGGAQPVSTINWVLGIAYLIIFILLILATYTRLGRLFTQPTYSVALRVLLPVVFVVIGAGLISVPIRFLSGSLPFTLDGLSRLQRGEWQALVVFLLVILAGMIPSWGFLYAFLVDVFTWLWLFFERSGRYLVNYHQPLPFELLHKLALEEIPSKSGSWTLTSLPTPKVKLLKEWAAANREGTDKRLWPTVILLSALAVLGAPWLPNLPRSIVNFFETVTTATQTLPLSATIQGVFFGTIVGLASWPIIAIVNLLDNLLHQSLITEACLLVESSQQDWMRKHEVEHAASRRSWTVRVGHWLRGLFGAN